jgi:hypothetical protein
LNEEDGRKLANYCSELFNQLKKEKKESNEITTLFPILRKLFIIHNDLDVNDIYHTLTNYYISDEYRKLKSQLLENTYFDIDAEAELAFYIVEHYDRINKEYHQQNTTKE